MSQDIRAAVATCLALALALISTFAFPALLPVFVAEWELTKSEAGWIAGVYYAAYTVAVAFLASLTDRVDARRVVLAGTATVAAAAAGFALFAQGLWSASFFQALAGVGLAGVYMPGLRALVDRYRGAHQPRAVAFYSASFSLGTALSFFAVGVAADAFGWRVAFAMAAGAALAGTLVVALALAPVPPPPPGRLLDFRPVLANRRAMGYVLGYGVHVCELFGLRSWMVAFLAFSLSLSAGAAGPAPATVASLAALVGMVASLGGAEVAARAERARAIIAFMLASAAASAGIGFAAALPYGAVIALVLVYQALVMLDSAALTTGAVLSAEEGRRGATLAMHSVAGFIGAAVGPITVGVVLDLMGGGETPAAWGAAFAAMGAIALLGPVALALLGRRASY